MTNFSPTSTFQTWVSITSEVSLFENWPWATSFMRLLLIPADCIHASHLYQHWMGKSSVEVMERVRKLELRAAAASSRDDGNGESSSKNATIPNNVLSILITLKRLVYEHLFTKSQLRVPQSPLIIWLLFWSIMQSYFWILYSRNAFYWFH